jgi:putative transposase
MSRSKAYPSDLTDDEWVLLEPLLARVRHDGRGRPRQVDRREVLNAIFYILRTGCQWRYLPEGFPNWNTVYWYFAGWTDDGTWERINDQLRRELRVQRGRDAEPSAAIIDSQSVKTTEKGGTAATMRASRSPGASATSWSILMGC